MGKQNKAPKIRYGDCSNVTLSVGSYVVSKTNLPWCDQNLREQIAEEKKDTDKKKRRDWSLDPWVGQVVTDNGETVLLLRKKFYNF